MQVDRTQSVNVRQYNLPTIIPMIVGFISILGVLWNQAGSRAKTDAETAAALQAVNTRIDVLQQDRVAGKTRNDAALAALNNQLLPLQQMVYRITTAEANIVSLGARADRQADVMNDLKQGIADLNTNFRVFSQKFDLVFPSGKSDHSELTSPPKEYRDKTRIQ